MTREEAIQVLQTALTSPLIYGEYAEAIDIAIDALTAETVQGEWIFNTDENNYKSWNICSVCGDSIFHKTNFCPNCGARMKGGDDE